MNIRETFNKLEAEVHLRLSGIRKEYDITSQVLEEYEGLERQSVEALLKEGKYKEAVQYDFQEFLPQVYYNNRRGEEVMGYLLGVGRKGYLKILDSDEFEITYFSYLFINSLVGQIEVLESLNKN